MAFGAAMKGNQKEQAEMRRVNEDESERGEKSSSKQKGQ
jgi:hypothetical protein